MKVAVLLLDSLQKKILTGIESFYCFEESKYDEKYNQLLDQLEHCTHHEATQFAKKLSDHFQINIHYSEFENNRTHFCCLTSNSHIGVIKGSVNQNEDPLHAIQREISEEVGVIIPYERLIKSSYSKRRTILYIVSLLPTEISLILKHIVKRNRQHCGELFHLSFRSINELTNNRLPMNNITKFCCELLSFDEEWPKFDPQTIQSNEIVETVPLDHNDEEFEDEEYEDEIKKKYYKHTFIKEAPFVWNKTRHSLLPLPSFVKESLLSK